MSHNDCVLDLQTGLLSNSRLHEGRTHIHTVPTAVIAALDLVFAEVAILPLVLVDSVRVQSEALVQSPAPVVQVQLPRPRPAREGRVG